ncbi:sigma-70 family RNA polymerase sigma factor [Gemmata sp. G18]|uniref:Sigma-70 family RNA polymerase sigma factor n=1 Tax=Gemmata palustris TaxID=2822762 RepID=A0ABS5C485_9BACT|nr:sigma-70 family RNA polymerase sigma factor [Gemmata palustris]MBP3960645.1 sigma-70 family RNA polymerase sigma factor [Gemmata palustris]
MSLPILTNFVRRLSARDEADGDLVRRYTAERSEAAFEELARRYGPAVFGVCRRALGDHHLAEDAFQAVFVVLARKAHTVRPPGAVGGWLFGVARKAAAEAAAMRRRKHRELLPGSLPDRSAPGAEPDDTAAAVDAEVAALPPALRAAVLLCEIEGLPRAEAAARLGIAEGTLSSRLAKARKVLAERLRRRGLAPAVGGVAAVPVALAGAASARADGRASGTVLELANGVLRTMLASNLRLVPVAVLALTVAVVGWAGDSDLPAAARVGPPAVAVRAAAPVPARKVEWVEEFALEHTSAVSAVAFGEKALATFEVECAQPRARVWNAIDGKPLPLEVRGAWFPKSPARALRFTKGDEHLLMTFPETFFDQPSGGTVRYRRIPEALVGDTMSGFDAVAFSADLTTFVNRKLPMPNQPVRKDQLHLHGNPWTDQKNHLNHRAVFEYPGGAAVLHADLSADGKRLAVAGDDAAVRVFDAATLKELHAIKLKKEATVTGVRLTDDGGRLAVVGAGGFARVYDCAGAELCALKGHDGTVVAVAFSSDGKRVATACGRVVRVFDATAGKPNGEVAGHADKVTALAFGPAGRRLISGSVDKTAKVWKLSD